MKFGQTLKAADAQAPAVFRGSFLNHKGMKKFLKYRCKQLDSIARGSKAYQMAVQASSKEFLTMLASQLKEVDRRFAAEAASVISTFDAKKPRRRSHILHRRPEASKMDPKVASELADRARWCQDYAKTNAQALRKICKKHDKVLKLKTGQQFLQACWRGDIAVRNFLSAPMLSELAAVEELAKSHSDPGHLADFASSSGMTSDSELADPDSVKCPICLDIMYLPVALECGHKLCARCAIATAVGHEGNRGEVTSLLASGPVGCSESPCPQCRATEHGNSQGVFFNAQRLPHLDELIKKRYPADWQRRKEEDEEEQQHLRATGRVPHGLFSFFRQKGLQTPSPQSSVQNSR